jgi:hypothetical protein
MRKAIILLFLITYITCIGQNVVPPVKKKSSGTLSITPNPNKNGKGQNNTSQTLATTGNQNSVTVIIDHSGSMNGIPLKAAKSSSQILVDLINLWGDKLFQNKIGNINFQYIEFGGKGEFNVLKKLGKITDSNQLGKKIANSSTSYGGTDFSSGMEPALTQLNGKNLNNKTIFLTDAGDGGAGPSSVKDYYKNLGDTKFIIYRNSGSSVNQKGWLNIVPNSSEFHVDNEYEVLSLFVKTLFEFVDDINHYLVRQGSQNVDIGKPFKIVKHSKKKRNLLIVSKPYGSSLSVEKIVDPFGKEVSKNSYTLYDAKTFFNIELHDSLVDGEYQIFFNNSTRSYNLYYISFERANIYLKLSTLPQLASKECFIENSSVNFNFKYWDSDEDKEIDYPDFLSHSAYHYKIENNVFDETGSGKNGLSFSHSFPYGSSGAYQVLTSWSYNEEKMKLYNNPPLSLSSNFCISPNGSLIHLDYNENETWEGRQLLFTATMIDDDQFILNNTKKLYLKTGYQTIVLKQDATNRTEYKGSLDYVKGNTQYSLGIENRDSRFVFALDKETKTSFLGKKRELIVTYKGKDYEHQKQKNVSTLFGRIKYVLSSKNVPIKEYKFRGTDIVIPYYLPYYDPVDDQVQFSFGLNKIFPDEKASLVFSSDSIQYTYPKDSVLVGGAWGMFSQEKSYSDAVTVKLFLKDSTSLVKGGLAIRNVGITKREGEMYFDKPLYKEPRFITNSSIRLSINNKQRIINLDQTNVRLDITTSEINKFYVITKWNVYKILLLILILFLLFVYGLLFIISKKKCNQKIKLWNRLKNNELSRLKDLWSEPSKHYRCNSKLELPSQLKNAFVDTSNKTVSKNALIEWIQSEVSSNHKEIRRKFCYRSIVRTSKIYWKVVYFIFLPISILVDLARNAFELDRRTIKNKDFLEYVQRVEDATIPNIPSEWSFKNTSRIALSFNIQDENAIRLRHISYYGKIAEITIVENHINIHALSSSINIDTTQGNSKFLTTGKQFSSKKGVESLKFSVNDEIEFTLEIDDYETKACTLNCYSITN